MSLALIFLAGVGCFATRHPILGSLCMAVAFLGMLA